MPVQSTVTAFATGVFGLALALFLGGLKVLPVLDGCQNPCLGNLTFEAAQSRLNALILA